MNKQLQDMVLRRARAQGFWRKLGWTGRGDPPPAWVLGFVEGAREVWDEIKDKVDAPPLRVSRRRVKRGKTKPRTTPETTP